jgi:hypothetical protein
MRTPLLLLSVCLALPPSLLAQEPGSPTTTSPPAASDPQAVTLLQNSLTALTGGFPITDVTMTGTITVNKGSTTESGTVTLIATAVGQSQLTVALPSGTWVTTENFATNPRTSSQTGPSGTTQDTAPEDLMGPHPAWFCPAMVIGAVAPQSYVASYVGQETNGASSIRHISFWPQTESDSSITAPQPVGQQVLTGPTPPPRLYPGQEELYLDSSSLLPEGLTIRIRGYTAKNGAPDPTKPAILEETILFSGYRVVQGREAPFHIEMSAVGSPLMDIQVSSIAFNTGTTVATN